ncbi:MAG: alpha/beta fold hydrolase [Gammaproteobacteria bacterium]|nr:alpha/beta fold hydrolase [Gammaproteobacteria bacterium]
MLPWLTVLILAGGYLGYVIVLYLTQARFVYKPRRTLARTPAALGLGYEEVTLRTDDGIDLHGWFLPSEDARATVLYLHGNVGNIADALEQAQMLHGLGLAVLLFDYRGYGRSPGVTTESGTYRDAEAAWAHLTRERGVAPERVLLYGHSLGGPIAAWLAGRHRPAGVILEGTFTTFPEMAAAHFPLIPARWLVRYRYPTREYLREVQSPVLIIHSRDDAVAPLAEADELFGAIRHALKERLEIAGPHDGAALLSRDTVIPAIEGFVARHLTP